MTVRITKAFIGHIPKLRGGRPLYLLREAADKLGTTSGALQAKMRKDPNHPQPEIRTGSPPMTYWDLAKLKAWATTV